MESMSGLLASRGAFESVGDYARRELGEHRRISKAVARGEANLAQVPVVTPIASSASVYLGAALEYVQNSRSGTASVTTIRRSDPEG